MTQFIHLKVHSEFSLVDGLVRIPQLMSAVAELAMPAVALTDVSNFYALSKPIKRHKVQVLSSLLALIFGWKIRMIRSVLAP